MSGRQSIGGVGGGLGLLPPRARVSDIWRTLPHLPPRLLRQTGAHCKGGERKTKGRAADLAWEMVVLYAYLRLGSRRIDGHS